MPASSPKVKLRAAAAIIAKARARLPEWPGEGLWHEVASRAIDAANEAAAIHARGGDVQAIAEAIAKAAGQLERAERLKAVSDVNFAIARRKAKMDSSRRAVKLKASRSHRLAVVYLLSPELWPSFAAAYRSLSAAPAMRCPERQARAALAELRNNPAAFRTMIDNWADYLEQQGRK